ncbi:MAG: 4-hydroxy-tetrahydrodipicolinate reductase [Alphaproteobacteria bacterium]
MSDADIITIAIAGPGGRVGQRLVAAVEAADDLRLVGGLVRPGSPLVGQALAGAPQAMMTDDPAVLLAMADVVIDFTTPAATRALALAAAGLGGGATTAGAAIVSGTTGLAAADEAALDRAAERVAVVHAANMSPAIHLLAGLVQRATKALGPAWDIEIVEMHHRHKVDAPSGTALLLGQAAAAGRGARLEHLRLAARDGVTGERPAGSIGFASLRGGDVVGEHQVILAGAGERVVLGHVAADRGLFAAGALAAARVIAGRPAGRYTLGQLMGLDD